MPEGWDMSTAPGWGMDGKELHGMTGKGGGIPVDSWCVSRENLIFLRAEIKKAIAKGEIKPTAKDNFGVADHKFGPNMYTCCDQYFQPLTKKAGSMSWALMRHPEGLKCDVFITHCWIEGIFEFIDKAVNSWPAGKKGAYVCILSNPQNLDIAALIEVPRESPFAKCLDSATHMLVVPNRSTSIYSRSWCVYEAWLASTMGRIIVTATFPIWREMLPRVGLQLLCLAIALIACMVAPLDCESDSLLFPLFVGVLTKLAVIYKGPDRWWLPKYPLLMAGNLVGVWQSALVMVQVARRQGPCKSNQLPPWQERASASLAVTFMVYFLFSEVDRVRLMQADEESESLRRGFTTVQNAECTSPVDSLNIKKEVQQEFFEVDEAIVVLMSAGMSTVALRAVHSYGADTTSAGRILYAKMWFSFGMFLTLNLIFLSLGGQSTGVLVGWSIFSSAYLATYVAWYFYALPDQRAFAVSVTAKINLFMPILLVLLTAQINGDEGIIGETSDKLPAIFGILMAGSNVITLLACHLGMVSFARIPLCGPWLASFLGPSTNIRCMCKRRKKRDSLETAISP
ncbi:unnamed protein product [Polarella glacialis]|nr:unnamed protein product [Polarella glacialis]